METTVTFKIDENILQILSRLSSNLEEINRLLKENNELLLSVIKNAFKTEQ